jgi:phosphate transport system substrate-binding protein
MSFHAMITRALLALAALASTTRPVGASTTVNGSGSTFAAPIMMRWASDFQKANKETKVNYQSVGSGAGVTQFLQNVTDFGASDMAMSDAEIAKADGNVILLPVTAGTIVLAYNVPGVEGLQLSRAAYVGIFLGTVTSWNDPAIASVNPGVKLPALPITVATRSDGSGTTGIFTAHLGAVSQDFTSKVGVGKSVTWPVGVAGKGNEGVTALIKQTPGSIGYVEYGYALNNKLAMASLENRVGNYIIPTIESGASTLASVNLPENFRAFITDPAGSGDYPIASFTWLLVRKNNPDPAKGAAIKEFITYGLTRGQSVAPELGYVTLPEPVVKRAQAALEAVK